MVVPYLLTPCPEPASQQPYYLKGFWGLEDENKSVLRVFVIWKNADHHVSLEKRFKNLGDVESSQFFSVNFQPSIPAKPLDSRMSFNTMVETIYFDKSFPHVDGWTSNFKKKVANILNERGDIFKAAAGGWATEKICGPNSSGEYLIWFAVVGWPSREAHLEWRGSPSHTENQKLLEQYKDWWKKLVRVHSHMHTIPKYGEKDPTKLSDLSRGP